MIQMEKIYWYVSAQIFPQMLKPIHDCNNRWVFVAMINCGALALYWSPVWRLYIVQGGVNLQYGVHWTRVRTLFADAHP